MPTTSTTRVRSCCSVRGKETRTLGPGFHICIKQYRRLASIQTTEAFISSNRSAASQPRPTASPVPSLGPCPLLFRKRTILEPTGCLGIISETPSTAVGGHDFGYWEIGTAAL